MAFWEWYQSFSGMIWLAWNSPAEAHCSEEAQLQSDPDDPRSGEGSILIWTPGEREWRWTLDICVFLWLSHSSPSHQVKKKKRKKRNNNKQTIIMWPRRCVFFLFLCLHTHTHSEPIWCDRLTSSYLVLGPSRWMYMSCLDSFQTCLYLFIFFPRTAVGTLNWIMTSKCHTGIHLQYLNTRRVNAEKTHVSSKCPPPLPPSSSSSLSERWGEAIRQ